MMPEEFRLFIADPINCISFYWPTLKFYDKQIEILESVRDNVITIVPAGNMLGKDFIAALCAVSFFVSRSPCKVVTSSVDSDQLETVLWGEMRRFIQSASVPLPLQYNHMQVRQIMPNGELEPQSTMIGRVAKKGEGMLGQHIARTADLLPRTFMIFDEGSGIEDKAIETAMTWAHRMLIIGNPFPCENLFRKWVKQGNVLAEDGKSYERKIIQIKADHSPNVIIGRTREERGLAPSDEIYIPGVIDWKTYKSRRKNWDKILQSVSLDGEFYEGAEILMYPPDWLNLAEEVARKLTASGIKRLAKALGIDTAEGGDETVWTVIDKLGILHQEGAHTTDTSIIKGKTIALMREYNLQPSQVVFDRGGGGKEHMDYLRMSGYDVRGVAFGESATTPEIKPKPVPGKLDIREERELKYVYKNRRAEMYGNLRYELLAPTNPGGFGIPAEYAELRRQLAPIPLLYDEEGRIYLPPKQRKRDSNSTVKTMQDLIGCSPDRADSLVLAVYGMLTPVTKRVLGATF